MKNTRIFIAVILFHLPFIVWIVFGKNKSQPVKARTHLVVHTVSPRVQEISPPQTQKTPQKTASIKKAPAQPKKKTAPQKKQTMKEKPVQQKKSIAPSKKAIPKDLIDELEERIAKIEQKRDKIDTKEPLKNLGSIKPLEIESIEKIEPSGHASNELSADAYQKMLIECLRQSLNLPDFGEVKIQLTLREDGSVANVIVLKAESQKNKRYLEENLPRLKFPNLQGSLSKKKQHTFSLVFCNE